MNDSCVAGAVCGTTGSGVQKLSLALKLAFWSPFSMEGYIAPLTYRGKGLGPASSDITDFVDFP